MNISEMLESSLLELKAAGLLQVSKPRRPSGEELRDLRRERRIGMAVDAMLAEIKMMEEEGCHFSYSEVTPLVLSLHDGVDFSLEEQADLFLADGRRGTNRESDPRDWLTREQLALRRAKETYNTNGVPDSALMRGIYKRVHNPLMGSRPTRRRSGDDA